MSGQDGIRDDDDLFFDDEFILDDDEAARSRDGGNLLGGHGHDELDEDFDKTEAELASGLGEQVDFDDGGEFVLDEGEAAAAGLNLDFSKDPGRQPLAADSAEAQLFGVTSAGQHQFQGDDERAFQEHGGRGWGGKNVDLGQLGLEGVTPDEDGPSLGDAEELREADATAMEFDENAELELVEHETDLEQSKSETADSVLQVRDDEGPEDGWEPAAELDEGEDLIYDDEEYEEQAGEELAAVGADADADYGDYEEGYVDEAAMGHAVAAPRPRSRFRSMLALAATVLLLGSLGVAWYKPELYLNLIGSKPDLVQETEVARPELDVKIDKPDLGPDVVPVPDVPDVKPDVKPDVMPDVVKTDGKPDTSTQTQPDTSGKENPPDYPIPNIAKPDLQPNQPLSTKQPEVRKNDVQAVQLGQIDRIPIGEGEGGYMTGEQVNMKEMRRSPTKMAGGRDFVMGSKALAQLKNNNIFIGRIKAIDSAYVTLNVEGGEISLALEDVRVLTHLALDEYTNLRRKGRDGYIYLRNNNRLKGMIVADRDDSVTLQVESNRVIIPKSAIEQIKDKNLKQVEFAEDDSIEKDGWVRKLVEQQIKERGKVEQPAGRVRVDPEASPGVVPPGR